MGSLSDLRLPTAEVEVPGAGLSLTLRGLSTLDVSALMKRHGEALNDVYETNIAGAEDLPAVMQVARSLMETAPLAVAEIIALANEAPDHVETVSKLPLPVQLECLKQIALLTFHSEAEVGKLLETVILSSETMTRIIKSVGA